MYVNKDMAHEIFNKLSSWSFNKLKFLLEQTTRAREFMDKIREISHHKGMVWGNLSTLDVESLDVSKFPLQVNSH